MKDALVSRMEVMSALVKEYNYRRTQDDWKGGLKLAWIEKAVSSVSEKRGTWIEKDGRIVCSNCGVPAITLETRRMEQIKTHYCWDCGANMLGGNHD